MENNGAHVLPYRTDPEHLARWLEARARGRGGSRQRDLDFPAKTLEGTAASAEALGFVHRDTGELSPDGQRFALGSEPERRQLLREAMRRFEPFRRLLEAVTARPERTSTDAQWIETWWATHAYGNSQSNRMEATAVFGRLVEHVGWGKYVPGRRGHPTRIQWSEAAFVPPESPPQAPAAPAAARGPVPVPMPDPPPAALADELPLVVESRAVRAPEGARPFNRVMVPLRSGEVARLEVPQRLPADEKRRLVELVELLITEEEE